MVSALAMAAPRPANGDRANEYDYEDEHEAAPAPVSRGRLSLLGSRGSRAPAALIGGRGSSKQATTPKPVEVPEPVKGEEGAPEDAPVTTTTEVPKKTLVRGGVRPFRSNEDLLAALKRRREQQQHGGAPRVVQVYPTPSSTLPVDEAPKSQPKSSPSRSSVGGRRGGFSAKAPAAAGSSSDPVVAEQPEPSRRSPSRKFSGRSKPTTPSGDNAEIEEEPTPKPKPTYRRRQ
ncbi:hypothetical protein C0J52_01152 [Blattella germanica]|nr:hypothetical protein C0J52_01152 [Blattella germanica]